MAAGKTSLITKFGVRVVLACLLAAAMSPAAILAYFQMQATFRDARRLEEARLIDAAARDALMLRDTLLGVRAAVSTLSRASTVLETDACGAGLSTYLALDERLAGALVYGPDGALICSQGEAAAGLDLTVEPVEKPRFFAVQREAGAPEGRITLLLVVPLASESGAQLVTILEDDVLKTAIAQSTSGSTWTHLTVVDVANTVIASDGDETAARLWLAGRAIAEERTNAYGTVFERGQAAEGGDVLIKVPLVRDQLWFMVGVPSSRVYAELGWVRAATLLLPFAMILVGVLLAYLAADRLIVRNVVYLGRIARAYGLGRLNLRAAVVERGAPRELVALSEDMAEMAGRLGEREASLKRSLDDNRALLFEVYHRVKNNLQMMVSLTNLQIRGTEDAAVRTALLQVRTRIYGLALAHEGMQLSEFSEEVRVDGMLRKLFEHVDIRPSEGGRVQARLEETVLPAEQAVPFGMLAAEALADPAFDPRAGGPGARHRVELLTTDTGGFRFRILREGPAPEASPRANRLAVRLMQGYARQLRAQLTVTEEPGRAELLLEGIAAERDAPVRPGLAASRRGLALDPAERS